MERETHERSTHRWEDKIEMGLKKHTEKRWTKLIWLRIGYLRHAVVHTAMNLLIS
jgi:hypothetical protein